MKKTRKHSYKSLRVLLCILLITALLFVSADRVVNHLFSEGLEPYRILLPITKEAALDDVLNDPRHTVDNRLLLVNDTHPLPTEYVADITEYKGVPMDSCVVEAYCALKEAVAQETSDSLYIASAARSREKQQELYQDDPTVAAKPGCSEHEAGLALDVYVEGFSGMSFIKSDSGRFVNKQCQKYGFIIRYPHYGEQETGIPYEPWHIRYVGKPHAALIAEQRLTLEEYIDLLEVGVFYKIDQYHISRQKPQNGNIYIPEGFEKLHLSPDNTGCYIVTAKMN